MSRFGSGLLAFAILGVALGATSAKEPRMSTEKVLVEEVERLHQLFEAWFTGRSVDFDAVKDALAPDFELIAPSGMRHVRTPLLERLRAARGAWPEGARITVRAVRARRVGPNLHLVTYEEWHHPVGESPRGRLSSALFEWPREGAERPLWLHVHETWLPETSDAPE